MSESKPERPSEVEAPPLIEVTAELSLEAPISVLITVLLIAIGMAFFLH